MSKNPMREANRVAMQKSESTRIHSRIVKSENIRAN